MSDSDGVRDDFTNWIPAHNNLPERYPNLDFRNETSFRTNGEPILLTDPNYLADVYHVPDGLASVVRQRGIIVNDFGGDRSGPVFWDPPFVTLCFGAEEVPEGSTVLSPEVGCDSGSFVFLPITEDLPKSLRAKIDRVLACRNGAALPLPSGTWTVYYDPYISEFGSLDRDIMLYWKPDEALQPRLSFPS